MKLKSSKIRKSVEVWAGNFLFGHTLSSNGLTVSNKENAIFVQTFMNDLIHE